MLFSMRQLGSVAMFYFCVFLFIPYLWVETSNSTLFLEVDWSALSGVAVDPEAEVTKCYY